MVAAEHQKQNSGVNKAWPALCYKASYVVLMSELQFDMLRLEFLKKYGYSVFLD